MMTKDSTKMNDEMLNVVMDHLDRKIEEKIQIARELAETKKELDETKQALETAQKLIAEHIGKNSKVGFAVLPENLDTPFIMKTVLKPEFFYYAKASDKADNIRTMVFMEWWKQIDRDFYLVARETNA